MFANATVPIILTATTALMAIGCGVVSKEKQRPHIETSAQMPRRSTPTSSKSTGAATSTTSTFSNVVFYKHDNAIWRVNIETGMSERTPFPIGLECAESLGVGSDDPVLSPDRRRLAIYNGDLFVYDTMSDRQVQVTSLIDSPEKTGAICIQIGDWSPDGRLLLYYASGCYCEECDHPSVDVDEGFYLWDAAQEASHPVFELPGYYAWHPDAQSVLFAKKEKRGVHSLWRVPLENLSPTKIATISSRFAFNQLSVGRQLLVFTVEGTFRIAPVDQPSKSEPFLSGEFAEYQRPALSPDGLYLAYSHRVDMKGGTPVQKLEVRSLDNPKDVCVLGEHRWNFEWFDSNRLLLCNSTGLQLVGIDGKTQQLAPPGACFVRTSPGYL